MTAPYQPLLDLELEVAVYAAPVAGGPGVGYRELSSVTPGSVMKIQVALAVERAFAEGRLMPTSQLLLDANKRTPGPTGISLMVDDVLISIRDAVIAMMTISDNAATDALITIVGLDAINQLTSQLGLASTVIVSDLITLLDDVAVHAGFANYRALAGYQPSATSAPTHDEVAAHIFSSSGLDPTIGTHTTPYDVVTLLQAIWTDRGGDLHACAHVRAAMLNQLTRSRIASGFSPGVRIYAKSGALLGVVRNESGVVEFDDGTAYAVAIFTRRPLGVKIDPALIDIGIGHVAREVVRSLHEDR